MGMTDGIRNARIEPVTGKVTYTYSPTPTGGLADGNGDSGSRTAFLPITGGSMTGPLILYGPPSMPSEAASKAYVDMLVAGGISPTDLSGFLNLSGGTMTGYLTLNGPPVNPLHAASKAYVDGVSSSLSAYLPRIGGTMTGSLVLVGAPTLTNEAATKGYVDGVVSSLNLGAYLLRSGGTMTGALTLSGPPTADLHAATKAYVDGISTSLNAYLLRSGGVMTGPITLSGAPTQDLHAATKLYVDLAVANVDLSAYLPRTGGTMLGAITLSGDPTQNLHAATKQYVDASVPPLSFVVYVEGSITTDGATLTYFSVRESFTFGTDFAACAAIAEVGPSAPAVFSVRRNGTEIGTISFGAGATTGVLATAGGAAVPYVVSDIFSITAPTPADTTMRNIGLSFTATRT